MPSATRWYSPSCGCSARTAMPPSTVPAAVIVGRVRCRPHDQVLRNQRVGSRTSDAASGPRLVTADPDQDVVGAGLGVLDDDVEEPVVAEDAGVDQLELGVVSRPPGVLGDELLVRERPLRIPVEGLEVGVARRRIEVVVELLDVLAVVAFGSGQPEQALLEDRVGAVPQGEGEAQPAAVIADPEQPVLPPAIGAGTRVIVRERRPHRAVRRSSPRGPCPIGARRDTVPSGPSERTARLSPRDDASPGRGRPVDPSRSTSAQAHGARRIGQIRTIRVPAASI